MMSMSTLAAVFFLVLFGIGVIGLIVMTLRAFAKRDDGAPLLLIIVVLVVMVYAGGLGAALSGR